MISLFEYGKWSSISDRESLEGILLSLWQNRVFTRNMNLSDADKDNKYQAFLQFDGNRIRAKNYVGFIQSGADIIEIYP